MLNVALLKNCVLVRIKTSSFGNTRKVEVTPDIAEKTLGSRTTETDEEWETKIDQALKRLKANKKLIVSEELDAITSYLAEFRNSALTRYCNPSFIDDGLYAVKNTAKAGEETPLQRLVADIKAAETKLRDELIPKFMEVYPAKINEARQLWNGSFREKDYPAVDKIRDAFKIKYRIVQLDIPEGLPPEIREQEEKKLRDEFEAARNQIVEALWTEFAKLVEHVVERLTPAADGKQKTFQKGTIENIQGFIEAFENRNAFNDERLSKAVDQAKRILNGVGDGKADLSQRLRDYAGVREKTAQAFATLKTEVDKGIQELPGRSFQFDED